ncbi:MAG: hypothetical protein ACXAEF_15565 [Candidatus Thorarchaeota archaeon]|jgi:hypothetical protein
MMAGELNFIIIVAVLGLMAFCCNTRCSSDSSSKGSQTLMIRVLMFLGMGSMVIGMALYYTFGTYAITLFSPWLVAGMILVLLAGCMGWRAQNYIPPPPPIPVQTTDAMVSDPYTLNQIAEAARKRGMLIERTDPDNPLEFYRSLRCPVCRYIFDLGKAPIAGFTVYCPSCNQGIELWQ